MQDVFGTRLQVGDEVIYVSTLGSSTYIRKFTIVGFTQKMVRILNHDARAGATPTLVMSHNLIWYPEDVIERESAHRRLG